MKRALIAVVLAAGAASAAEPLQTVGDVDLSRYAGQWHEVAKYPNRFQRQCVGDTTATYALRDDGNVGSSIAAGRADGRTRPAGLRAASTGAPTASQVSFLPAALRWLPIGWGDYWIIELASDYRYAVSASRRGSTCGC